MVKKYNYSDSSLSEDYKEEGLEGGGGNPDYGSSVSPDTVKEYLKLQLNEQEIEQVRFVLLEKFKNYIDNYNGVPLSEEWVSEKGQSMFWKGLHYNKGSGAFTDIFPEYFEFIQQENGTYNLGYFQVLNMPERFTSACDKFSYRRFLPGNERAFTEGGESTDDFCRFLTHMSVESAIDVGIQWS